MAVAPNKEQILSALRWLIALLGSLGLGAIFSKYPILSWVQGNLEMIASVGAVLLSLVWGLFRHTEASQVAATIAIPDVAKVVTTSTPAGVALADKVPSAAVQSE